MKLVCFQHPKYDGQNPPILSCKTCCSIYVDQMKADQEKQSFDAYAFMERKKKEARSARKTKPIDFHPELI